MSIITVFGTNLRKYRVERRMSQEELAVACKLHRTYISDIERFKRNASLESVQKIAEALGIEPYMLLQDENEQPADK